MQLKQNQYVLPIDPIESIIRSVLVSSLCMLTFVIQSEARPPELGVIPFSRDITNSVPPTRADYLEVFPETYFTLHAIDHLQGNRVNRNDEEGRVLLVVNHRLLGVHERRFDVFSNDLIEEGYDLTLFDVEGGTAAELKSILIQQNLEDVVGVIFAGEMPLAWFEQPEHFYSEIEPDNNRLAEYPIDLFFMDWDGEWLDTSGNGIYDVHRGAWEPDVWIGRIAGYNLSRINEDSIVGPYLDRLHLYRSGELQLPHKALGYIDDDWRTVAIEWGIELGIPYGFVNLVADPETTSAVGYSEELTGPGYELVQVAVHSTTDTHAFLVERQSRYDYFRFRTLREEIEPHAFFYNLFACSAMNLDRNLCLGALYALKGPYGMGSVGPAKVGGMLFYEDYYTPLAEGASFGEALQGWLRLHAHEPGHENWSRSWFYGMTHFGDPTLKLPRGLRIMESLANDETGDGDGVPDAGEEIELSFIVTNRSEFQINEVTGTVTSNDSLIEIVTDEFAIGDVVSGEMLETEGIRLRLDPRINDGHKGILTVRMEPNGYEPWWDRVVIEVRSPHLSPVAFELIPSEGDADGFVGAGELGSLVVALRNDGGNVLRDGGIVTLEPLSEEFDLENSEAAIPPAESGRTVFSSPFPYGIAAGSPADAGYFVRMVVTEQGIRRGIGVIAIPTSRNTEFASTLDEFPGWTLDYPVSEGYANAWRWSESAGENSGGLAFGGPDTTLYPARADASIELPLLLIDNDAVLTIRHRIDIEADYDAAVVEFDRGMGWERATPVGGYNGRSVANGSFPGGPCWNGTFDWRDDQIHLGGPASPLRLRLRFASDSGIEGEGWFIDRLAITGTQLSLDPPPSLPVSSMVLEAFPNPFNSTLVVRYSAPSGSKLLLFTTDGRQVLERTLQESICSINLSFENERLSPGIYVARLEAGKNARTIKLVYIK